MDEFVRLLSIVLLFPVATDDEATALSPQCGRGRNGCFQQKLPPTPT
jgi:hypothetical protein